MPSADDVNNNEAPRTPLTSGRLTFQVESLTSTGAQLARRRQGEHVKWIKHESPLSEIFARAVCMGRPQTVDRTYANVFPHKRRAYTVSSSPSEAPCFGRPTRSQRGSHELIPLGAMEVVFPRRSSQAIHQPKSGSSKGTLEHAGSSIIGATRPKQQRPTGRVTSVWCLCQA